MNELERIAQLETRLDNLDSAVQEIKKEQAESRGRSEKSVMDMIELKNLLVKCIDELASHQEWHKGQTEKKYKITDIILALGMVGIAILEFMK